LRLSGRRRGCRHSRTTVTAKEECASLWEALWRSRSSC
jgi:hypothetical protein